MKQATAKINNSWLYTLIGQILYRQMVDAEQLEQGEAVQIKLEFETVPIRINTRVEINGEEVEVNCL